MHDIPAPIKRMSEGAGVSEIAFYVREVLLAFTRGRSLTLAVVRYLTMTNADQRSYFIAGSK